MAPNKNDAPAAESKELTIDNLASFMFGDTHNRHFKEALWQRAPKEVACALTASLLVSPMVSIIDKCIVQNIADGGSFTKAMGAATKEMFVSPVKFFGGLSFRVTAAVYFGTYAVANLAELCTDIRQMEDETERKTFKVGTASVANVSLLAWRDSVFARAFSAGGEAAKKSTPLRTIGLFAARDTMTMYATFNLAPRGAIYVENEYGIERNAAELGCALGIPMVMQFITAPWHIYAMDYYNNRTATFGERIATLKKEMPTVCFARGLRILPAFGIGSFSNNKFREHFIKHEYDAENFHLPYDQNIAMATSPSRK